MLLAGLLLAGVVSAPAASAATTTTLVPAGSTWRVNDSGADLGTAWRSPSYSDGSWIVRSSQVGYGDGDEVSTVAPSRITYYLRKSFSVTSTAGATGLTLRTLVDDGAVVYLNGTEIHRWNVPTGQTAATRATTALSGSAESTWRTVNVPPTALRVGTNVLAIEVHNAATWSSDISHDAELSLQSGVPAIPTGLTAGATSPTSVSLSWTPVPGATSYSVVRDGTTVALPGTSPYTDATVTAARTYSYRVVAHNSAGSSPASSSVSVTTPAVMTSSLPRVRCRISDPRLTEMSGLATSLRHSGVVWTHNDSGDGPRIFALDTSTCAIRAEVTLGGAGASDYEAIGVGRDPQGNPEIWVADIGNNSASRSTVRLYRLSEPTLATQTLPVQIVTVTWSDGARDAEGLMVEPTPGGRLFLVSKEQSGGVYQLRGDFRTSGAATTGTRVSTVRSYVTDAAVALDGSRSVVRSGNYGTLFTGVPGTSPVDVRFPEQRQGEALTFSRDAKSLLLTSEGTSQELLEVPLSSL